MILLLYSIRKTCPCNTYPLKPHFDTEKLGYAGVYLSVEKAFQLTNFSTFLLFFTQTLNKNIECTEASGKHVRVIYTPLSPKFYSKSGEYSQGIPIFLIFAPKHRLWVIIRTASSRRFLRVPNLCFEQK